MGGKAALGAGLRKAKSINRCLCLGCWPHWLLNQLRFGELVYERRTGRKIASVSWCKGRMAVAVWAASPVWLPTPPVWLKYGMSHAHRTNVRQGVSATHVPCTTFTTQRSLHSGPSTDRAMLSASQSNTVKLHNVCGTLAATALPAEHPLQKAVESPRSRAHLYVCQHLNAAHLAAMTADYVQPVSINYTL